MVGVVIVKVTKDYKITLPKEVIQALEIKPGDKIAFVKANEGYIIMKYDDLLDQMCEELKEVKEVEEEVRESFRRAIEELEKDETF